MRKRHWSLLSLVVTPRQSGEFDEEQMSRVHKFTFPEGVQLNETILVVHEIEDRLGDELVRQVARDQSAAARRTHEVHHRAWLVMRLRTDDLRR